MSVQRRSILGDTVPSGSSGDGSGSPSQTDPVTGQSNPGYQAPTPSKPLDATWQGDPLNSHAELASAYRDSYIRHSGVESGAGSEGVDLGETGSDEGSGNDYDGDVADFIASHGGDTGTEFAKTIAGTDPLVTRTAGADRGYQFGEAIG